MIAVDELEKLLGVCKKYEVKKFQMDALVLEFSDSGFQSPIIQETHKGIPQEGLPTHDELLFWSADSPLEETKEK